MLERKKLVERTHVTVWEDRVRLSGGTVIDDFCLIESPDWAGVLCLTREGRVPLVRQYRHGAECESLELPAGALEPGESALAAAQRELLEETGHASTDWVPLGRLWVDPSRQRACGHFYLAREARRVASPQLDAGEELQTVLVSLEELMRAVDSGRIFHGLHVAAILSAQRRGLI